MDHPLATDPSLPALPSLRPNSLGYFIVLIGQIAKNFSRWYKIAATRSIPAGYARQAFAKFLTNPPARSPCAGLTCWRLQGEDQGHPASPASCARGSGRSPPARDPVRPISPRGCRTQKAINVPAGGGAFFEEDRRADRGQPADIKRSRPSRIDGEASVETMEGKRRNAAEREKTSKTRRLRQAGPFGPAAGRVSPAGGSRGLRRVPGRGFRL